MSKYKDFEFIKTITNLNEVIDEYSGWAHFYKICYYHYSNLEVIKYCVEHGADFNIKNDYGKTPFYWICRHNTGLEVLEYCLEHGADLTITDYDDHDLFYWICRFNIDLIKYCKPYMNEYDYIKTLKNFNLNWKEYV